ncbi:hypothetical protein AB0N14_06845 [Streptomyces sp. NPDC051104]|uniref:hypothetical protein n=1 Tax=Streptomyces sp. NPDC051104 TaxID=3155044 RepID=UPI0034274372
MDMEGAESFTELNSPQGSRDEVRHGSALSTLIKESRGSSDDLGTLIRQLVRAAQPLEGKFNGAGRVAFDQVKARADNRFEPDGRASKCLG